MYPVLVLDLRNGAAGTAGKIDVSPRIVANKVFFCEFGTREAGDRIAGAMLIKLVHTNASDAQEIGKEVCFCSVECRFEYETGTKIGCGFQNDEAGEVEIWNKVKSKPRPAAHADFRLRIFAEILTTGFDIRRLYRRYDCDVIRHWPLSARISAG